MSLVDMQPALGVNGIFNVYLSQKYGLVVTTKNGNQVMWPIPGY
jgi:hypothetical protein